MYWEIPFRKWDEMVSFSTSTYPSIIMIIKAQFVRVVVKILELISGISFG
jgi:hypothetical protein